MKLILSFCLMIFVFVTGCDRPEPVNPDVVITQLGSINHAFYKAISQEKFRRARGFLHPELYPADLAVDQIPLFHRRKRGDYRSVQAGRAEVDMRTAIAKVPVDFYQLKTRAGGAPELKLVFSQVHQWRIYQGHWVFYGIE